MTTTPTAPPPVLRHSALEDVLAVATGAVLVSLGVFLLERAGAVTGGVPGLALLLGHGLALPFAVLYAAASAPFLVVAAARFGLGFTARTVVAVAAVAAFSLLHPYALTVERVSPAYATLLGSLAVGIGLVVLFRHGTSLGGFGVLALLAQERRGWSAGWVQLVVDGTLVLAAALVAPLETVALSAGGVVLLNVVLALNHRPGRYLA